MNTADAATTAGVTIPTIRTWCRRGVIAATKRAGRWFIEAASLNRRITISQLKKKAPKPMPPATPDHTREFIDEVTEQMYGLADRYSAAGLTDLLTHVRNRNTLHLTGIPADHVHLTTHQWGQVERSISTQLGCLRAEH